MIVEIEKMFTLPAKIVYNGPIVGPYVQEPAGMQDSLRQALIVVVLASDIVEAGQHKLLDYACSRRALPFKRAACTCLVLSINYHRVMRSRATEEVAPDGRAVVPERARVGEQFLAAGKQDQG